MRSARLLLLASILTALLAPAPASSATTTRIALSPEVGPPTTVTRVRGSGFSPTERIILSFGSFATAKTRADGDGQFEVRLQAPGSSLPGDHTVSAIGQRTGRIAEATFLVRTDWAEFRKNGAHTGYNPFENVLSPQNVSELSTRWSFATGYFVASSPAVAHGVVYMGSRDTNVYALDAATGAKRWSFATRGWVDSSPAVANGVVYVGSADHQVYALDAATGAKRWSFATGNAVFSSPAVANGVVYVGSWDHNVYALDAATGAERWSFATGDVGRLDRDQLGLDCAR